MAIFLSAAKRQTKDANIWYDTLNSPDIYLRDIRLGHIVVLFLDF